MDTKIQVIIRKRPLNSKEIQTNQEDVVNVLGDDTVHILERKQKVDLTKFTERHEFVFDQVFDEEKDNQFVFQSVLDPILKNIFKGTKITCFAYGQTGSGKTFTMMGVPKQNIDGLYQKAVQRIYQHLGQQENNSLRIGVSFFEIYCDKVFDLLNNREQCIPREDNKGKVQVQGLKELIVPNMDSFLELMQLGLTNRVVGKTGMNDNSSRSHAILQIVVRNMETKKKGGQISFIDLAGNERGSDVKTSNNQTRQDGAEINKSLLALKECIRALDSAKQHLPFRGSKLTMVLKESFMGDCQTLMIGNVSPSIKSTETTLNTLRYADRVKELKSGGAKGKPKGDNLMLARDRNKNTIIEYVVKKEEDDFEFEEYRSKNFKQEAKTVVNFNKKDKQQKEESFQDSDSSDQKTESYQKSQQKQNFVKEEGNQQQQKQIVRNSNKLLENKSGFIQEPVLFKKAKENSIKLQVKQPIKKQQQKKQQKKEEGVSQEFVNTYDEHIQAIVGITWSDMRNLKQLKNESDDQKELIDKIYQNIQEKEEQLQQFREFLQDYEQQLESQTESNSRKSLSEDPFREGQSEQDDLMDDDY